MNYRRSSEKLHESIEKFKIQILNSQSIQMIQMIQMSSSLIANPLIRLQ